MGVLGRFFGIEVKEDREKKEFIILAERLKSAELHIQTLKDTLHHEQRYAQEMGKEAERRKEMLVHIMESLCNGEYIKMQLGDVNRALKMKPQEITDFIIKNVKEQIRELKAQIKALQSELEQKDAHIRTLEAQLARLVMQKQASVSDVAEVFGDNMPEILKNVQNLQPNLQSLLQRDNLEEETPVEIPNEAGKFQIEAEPKSEPEVPVPVELDRVVIQSVQSYIEQLNDQTKLMLQVIGETGLFRTKELKSHPLITANIPPGSFFYVFGMLKNLGLLYTEKIHTGRKGYYYEVFWLNEVGERVFQALFGKKSVASQAEKLRAEHATIRHACMVLDAADTLSELGFRTCIDRKKNTFAISNSRQVVVDVVAEKEGERRFVEVETGDGHDAEELYDKMDRLYEITRDFYFVAPNKEKMEELREVYFEWVRSRGGSSRLAGLIGHFTTMENLVQDKWDRRPIGKRVEQ